MFVFLTFLFTLWLLYLFIKGAKGAMNKNGPEPPVVPSVLRQPQILFDRTTNERKMELAKNTIIKQAWLEHVWRYNYIQAANKDRTEAEKQDLVNRSLERYIAVVREVECGYSDITNENGPRVV